MKHNYSKEGLLYRLRPVELSDAGFIIETRLEDAERNRFLHTISDSVEEQQKWLTEYFKRPGDYYFVVENMLTGLPEGLISFYDEKDGSAYWGRWCIKKDSLAAAESVNLLYQIAFEQVGLNELYCRTVVNNTGVVSFHESIGEKTRLIIKDEFLIDGKYFDAIEQYADRGTYYNTVKPTLDRQSEMIYRRAMKKLAKQ